MTTTRRRLDAAAARLACEVCGHVPGTPPDRDEVARRLLEGAQAETVVRAIVAALELPALALTNDQKRTALDRAREVLGA